MMTTDRHCRKCGRELPGLFDYCPYCGEAVFSDEDKELFEVLRKLRLRLAKLKDNRSFHSALWQIITPRAGGPQALYQGTKLFPGLDN